MSVFGEVYDITIVGAGPVGLYAAIYAGNKKLKVKVIESQPFAGGRLIAHYPDKTIYDVAGQPAVVAKELITKLEEQAEKTKPQLFFNQKVEALEQNEDGVWTVKTTAGEHRSRAVLIATGTGAFIPEKLNFKSAGTLEGKSIFYSIDKLEKFKGKRVLIAGTGDHAYEWAVKVAEVAKHVVLAHRLNHLHKPDDIREVDEIPNLTLKFPFYEVAQIHGDNTFTGATIVCSSTGETEAIEADVMILNIGSLANLNEMKGWGLAMGENSIQVDATMETNLPGVFAAGDIVTHPGKIKLISTGAGEAAIAVNSIINWLKEHKVESKRKASGSQRLFEKGGLFYSAFEATKLAVLLAEEGLKFYQVAFDLAHNKGAKQVFAKLQRYKLDTVKKLMESVLPHYSSYANEDLDDTATSYLKSEAGKHSFAGNNLAMEAQKNAGSDLQNIYTAIRVEEDMRAYLDKLIAEDKLKKTRAAFEALREETQRQLDELRAQQAQLMEIGIAE